MRFAEAPQRATRRPRECERTRQRSECGCRHGRGIPATRGPIGRASAPSAGPEPADSPKYSCMRITFLGHAGLFVETRHGSVLCDPWFTPAYFGSWFPFPRNDRLDPAEFGRPDFLYVSHLHRDHFDPEFLGRHVGEGHPGPAPGLPDAVPRGGAARPRVHAGSSAPAPERRSRSTASRSRSSP